MTRRNRLNGDKRSRLRPDVVFVFAVMLLTIAASAIIVSPYQVSVLRGGAALLLVLVFPGCALTAATFPARPFAFAERVLLAFGISVTVTIVGGILLNVTPWGLHTATWTASLSGITVAAGVVAFKRIQRTAPPEPALHPSLQVGVEQIMILALAGIVAIVAVGVAIIGAVHQPFAGFTQLAITMAADSTDNAVRVEIVNREASPLDYRCTVALGETIIAEWPEIHLASRETWTMRVALPVEAQRTAPVNVLLYRADAPNSVYREVTLAPSP